MLFFRTERMHVPPALQKFTLTKHLLVTLLLLGAFLIASLATVWAYQGLVSSQKQAAAARVEAERLSTELADRDRQLEVFRKEPLFSINERLMAEMKALRQLYKDALTRYEQLLDLRQQGAKTQIAEQKFSLLLANLAADDAATGSAQLAELDKELSSLQTSLVPPPAPAPISGAPAGSQPPVNNQLTGGYNRQTVESDAGSFVVDVLMADLGSTRVVVETASSENCTDGCPVAALADYVARAGGFAGINGPYFCPAEYPSCAGKTNSFDTLLMNRNKFYFNSDNNIYSTVPALIFSDGGARLVGQSLEWGRDTGVDSVIASQPMLVANGEVAFGGDGDPKKGSRGNRSFIGVKDNNVVIGVVRNATVAEVARVLKAMGLRSALNLDSGGSTAFFVNGRYAAGPGRQTPFGIVLVRK